MEIPSYQDLSLVNYWFGTFLEEKLLKESKGTQVCLNYPYSQTECETPIFQLLVLKGLSHLLSQLAIPDGSVIWNTRIKSRSMWAS